MYHKWLDRWDEKRAQKGDEVKRQSDFIIDADLAFSNASRKTTIAEFCDLADKAVASETFFKEPNDSGFAYQDGWVTFPSEIVTDIPENNNVTARVTESGLQDHALVVFHHWNASKRNNKIAKYFSKKGITVVEIAMPYHFERSRPDASYADYILSPNIGRTLESIKQAVSDGRKLIQWLKHEGYSDVSVFGMSLGSWVAGLIAAHDRNVKRASLFLTAGSLADMVWTGRATVAIRQSLEPDISLENLRHAWRPISLDSYTDQLCRPDLKIHAVLAKRDTVVLPALSHTFLATLSAFGAKVTTQELNCGHYSLALPPHIIFAGLGLKRILNDE